MICLDIRDELDFDLCVFGQACDLNGGTGRAGAFGEKLSVDRVHGGKVVHVGEEDGGLPTSAMEPPAASTMALPFVSDCFVCAETSSG